MVYVLRTLPEPYSNDSPTIVGYTFSWEEAEKWQEEDYWNRDYMKVERYD